MSVEIEKNFNVADLDKQIKKQLRTQLDTILFTETAVLKSRLLSGVDIDNKAVASYAPYSKQYAKRRLKRGRPIDKVTWSFTGNLIKSITRSVLISRSKNSIIGKIRARGKGNILRGLLKSRPRHWGLTEKQEQRIARNVKKNLNFRNI